MNHSTIKVGALENGGKMKDSTVQYSPITSPECYLDLTNYPLKYYFHTCTHNIPWQNQGNKK